MAIPSNIKLSVSEVSQEIDLEEVAGIDLSRNPRLKEVIGQALIDLMVNRTKSGKDINRNPLAAYKKSYKESDQFEAFAKDNKVDMELSGNMLSDIGLDTPRNKIKIKMQSSVNNAKAYNHMVGDTVRQREWFGVRDKDVKQVLSAFSEEIAEATGTPTDEIGKFIKRIREGRDLATASETEEATIISVRDLFGES